MTSKRKNKKNRILLFLFLLLAISGVSYYFFFQKIEIDVQLLRPQITLPATQDIAI